MENIFKNTRENKESAPELDIVYGLDKEVERVESTLKKLPWYKEQGYLVKLPNGVSEQSTPEEILNAVSFEYSEEKYEDFVSLIEKRWPEIADGLKELEKIASFQLKDIYTVFLTRYGVGGSYDFQSGKLTVNIEGLGKSNVMKTIPHEIVHIGIQHLINSFGVKHWYKERLVDLITGRIFPELNQEQKIKEDASVVDEAFNKYFPDIETITKEIGDNQNKIPLVK